jgi:hypothetical protein
MLSNRIKEFLLVVRFETSLEVTEMYREDLADFYDFMGDLPETAITETMKKRYVAYCIARYGGNKVGVFTTLGRYKSIEKYLLWVEAQANFEKGFFLFQNTC